MRPARIHRGRGRRTSPGQMNGLERRYRDELMSRKLAEEVLEFWFEPLRIRLAPNTFYVPDFLVLMADLSLEIHEVKGHWEDDARVKIKVAAAMYPFRFLGVQHERNRGWKFEEF